MTTPALLEVWFQSLGIRCTRIDRQEYQAWPGTYHDLFTPEQKKASHWADAYTSGVRVSYRATPGGIGQ